MRRTIMRAIAAVMLVALLFSVGATTASVGGTTQLSGPPRCCS